MTYKGIPVQDIVSAVFGIVGLISAYVSKSHRLPPWVRRWVGRIGMDRIQSAVNEAEKLAELSPEDRRKAAVDELQRLTNNELGFSVPRSIANLIVEWGYQIFKKGR